MFLALSAIILAISSGVTTFIQTLTLSGCRVIECCSSSCQMGESVAEKKDDDLPVALKSDDVGEESICTYL